MRCSRCGKVITDIAIGLSQKLDIYKVTEQGYYESCNNLAEETHELLCQDCFNVYADCMDKLNEEYEGKYNVNLVDVVDEVQYGDEIL